MLNKILSVVLVLLSLKGIARYDCKIFLTARDCSSCMHMSAAMDQLPYFIRPDVYVDGNLDSAEFDYFIDTLLNLDRKRYNFYQSKKDFTLDNINVLYFLNATGNAVFKCRLAEIPVYLDSIKQHYTDFYEVNKIPITQPLHLLSRAILSKVENNIFIFNRKLHELVVINNDSCQYNIRAKDLPVDSVVAIIFGDTSKIASIKNTYANPNVFFPPIEMQAQWYDEGYVYILYVFHNPTIHQKINSNQANIQFIPVYFIGQYQHGSIKKIYRIKQKGFAEIDKEQNSVSIFHDICFMVKKDKLYLTLENVKPKEQKYYLCEMELNKPKNIFEFSKKITTGINPIASSSYIKNSGEAYNLNLPFLGDSILWFRSQNLYFDFRKGEWKYFTFHLPKIFADTATIFRHNLLSDIGEKINNKYRVITILSSGQNGRSNNFYTTIFDENMKQLDYYNIYNFMICNKSVAMVNGDLIYVIEQDKNLHIYAIKHGLN